ncbi:hypothetical protein C815_00200 [Firmicutes bacterium M10-2]|nr:hypothetical protein C815_00200 [Firmicutes bacterium M10-2]
MNFFFLEMNEKEIEIQKIREMESIYDELEDLLEKNNMQGIQQNMARWNKLFDWYFYGTWQQDHKKDEEGYFPSTLKRGVLSEDAIYDLFMRLSLYDIMKQKRGY